MIIWPLLKAAAIVYPFVTMAAKPTRFVKKCKHSYVNEVIVQYNTNCQIFLRNSRGKNFCTLSKNVTKNCLVHSSQGTNKCSHEQRFSIQLNRFRIPNSKLEKIDQSYKQMTRYSEGSTTVHDPNDGQLCIKMKIKCMFIFEDKHLSNTYSLATRKVACISTYWHFWMGHWWSFPCFGRTWWFCPYFFNFMILPLLFQTEEKI
jgi:hypothetical protein